MNSLQAYCHRVYDFDLDTIKLIETLQSKYALSDYILICKCLKLVSYLSDQEHFPLSESNLCDFISNFMND